MKSVFWLLPFVGIALACKKDEPLQESSDQQTSKAIYIQFVHHVDGSVLKANTYYTNSAGNLYSINRLEYYISELTINNDTNEKLAELFYLNAFDSSSTTIFINSISTTISSIDFTLGLDSVLNQSNNLPNTIENVNMIWPDQMGGGYHFIKLEGHYKQDNSVLGYAMHVGTNSFHYQLSVPVYFDFASSDTLQIFVNINNWFNNPNTYNLNDASYIMGNEFYMRKFIENSIDVFSSQQ